MSVADVDLRLKINSLKCSLSHAIKLEFQAKNTRSVCVCEITPLQKRTRYI